VASTRTVQQVVNYASTQTELMPLAGVGGYSNEPALTFANDTIAEIVTPAFPWKFNQATMNTLVTQLNRQDYLFAGATAFVLSGKNVVGGAGIGLASNNAITESSFTVTVNTLEPHNFAAGDVVYMIGNTVAAYNSALTVTPSLSSWSGGWTILTTPTTTSFTFTHASSGLASSGAAGITDFGWAQYGTMVDENDTSSPQGVWDVGAFRTLQPYGHVGRAEKFAVAESGTAGILKIRFYYAMTSSAFGVSIVYQMKAPTITSLGQSWTPIPDEFAFMVNQVFLGKAFRHYGSAKADDEEQKGMLAIQKAMGRDDAEQSDEYIAPETPLMGYYYF
jgi:hypothetical protein